MEKRVKHSYFSCVPKWHAIQNIVARLYLLEADLLVRKAIDLPDADAVRIVDGLGWLERMVCLQHGVGNKSCMFGLRGSPLISP
jgi:hypothetical protein